MNDNGISAAIRVHLRMFQQASRQTGRSEAMLQAARPGDHIITATEAEARRLTRRLREIGKLEVTVSHSDPAKHPMRSRGTNPDGATIFDHTWIEGFWAHSLDQAAKEIAMYAAEMSKAPAPDQQMSPIARAMLDLEFRY